MRLLTKLEGELQLLHNV